MAKKSLTSLIRRQPENVAVHPTPTQELRPEVDIYENADELLMLADMPGATTDSVAVRLEGAQLTLEADRPLPNGGAIRYTRAFRMPSTIDPDGVSAELKHGVLHVHAKKSEAAKPRTIQVRAS